MPDKNFPKNEINKECSWKNRNHFIEKLIYFAQDLSGEERLD